MKSYGFAAYFTLCFVLLTSPSFSQTWSFSPPRLRLEPPDLSWKIKLGQAKSSCSHYAEKVQNLRSIVEEAKKGRVPYAGMTPEWVLKHNEPALRKAEARWEKKRKAYYRLYMKYQKWLHDRNERKKTKEKKDAQEDDDLPEKPKKIKIVIPKIDEPKTKKESKQEAEYEAKVTYVFGQVEVFRNAEWVKLKVGDELADDDKFRTGRRSKIEMVVPSLKKVVRIKPNSMMKLSAKKFEQKHGDKLWYTCLLLFGGAKFTGIHIDYAPDIKTPKATVGTRGTTFSIDVNEKTKTEIYKVEEGAIEVKSNVGDQKWLLEAGSVLELKVINGELNGELKDSHQDSR